MGLPSPVFSTIIFISDVVFTLVVQYYVFKSTCVNARQTNPKKTNNFVLVIFLKINYFDSIINKLIYTNKVPLSFAFLTYSSSSLPNLLILRFFILFFPLNQFLILFDCFWSLLIVFNFLNFNNVIEQICLKDKSNFSKLYSFSKTFSIKTAMTKDIADYQLSFGLITF